MIIRVDIRDFVNGCGNDVMYRISTTIRKKINLVDEDCNYITVDVIDGHETDLLLLEKAGHIFQVVQ